MISDAVFSFQKKRERDHLNGLTQAHLVGQAAANSMAISPWSLEKIK
jgi:hypothetical protein